MAHRRLFPKSSHQVLLDDANRANFTQYNCIIDAPTWPVGFEKYVPDKPSFKRLLHWGPIIALIIILLVGSTATYLHIQWWPLKSSFACIHFVSFLFLNYCTLTNLCRSSLIGPGYLPFSWRPPDESFESRLQFCKICDGYKAPRSHHCCRCGRCVLKMDHHCPWINNCVGHRNHAYFIRFLVAAVIGCIHAVFIISCSIYYCIFRVWYIHYGIGDEPEVILSVYLFICSVFALGLAVGVIIAVGFLLFIQLKSVLKNRTGIEDYIVNKAESRERSDPFLYPYNLGWKRNFLEVLGTWDGSTKGNGVWWPVISPATQFSFSEEQLIQKRIKRENAYEVNIVRSFPGGYCKSISFGIRTWIWQPWTDESRIAVKEGEHWLVTRADKYWLYGTRKDNPGDLNNGEQCLKDLQFVPRGWFPRSCVDNL